MNIAAALKEATSLLKDNTPRARFEAELLLAYHLGVDRVYLARRDDEEVDDIEGYFALIRRRAQSEPYEYIINKVSFYDIELYVDNRVLIPRPETELLIDEVSKIIAQNSIKNIAEIGVGSGAISIVLARAFPKLKVVATDISSDALEVATLNREKFALEERIELVNADLLGGVILFDYNPIDKNKPKNIASKEQLKTLSAQLQACSKDQKLLIAIDQEGGKVQRLKSQYGFYGNFPSAAGVSKMSSADTLETYRKMGKELKDAGINYDLAPVVDLAINSKNHVIYELGRSYGANPKDVAASASLFLQAMHEEGVLTSLKHFPGHGSSLGDTHKGYVDVTKSWSKQELEPFKLLKSEADSMSWLRMFSMRVSIQNIRQHSQKRPFKGYCEMR